jgi:hypothetical protein
MAPGCPSTGIISITYLGVTARRHISETSVTAFTPSDGPNSNGMPLPIVLQGIGQLDEAEERSPKIKLVMIVNNAASSE